MIQVLNKCPICGGVVYINRFYQYSLVSKIGRKGLPLKKRFKTDDGPMDCFTLSCATPDCFYVNGDLDIETPPVMRKNSYVDIDENGAFFLVTEDEE